ncbi:MAG: hypothetical protein HC871_01010 [Rhizobiales bacterium]|nr:hypothetical protein [Hyphomicrobiales bacterium]
MRIDDRQPPPSDDALSQCCEQHPTKPLGIDHPHTARRMGQADYKTDTILSTQESASKSTFSSILPLKVCTIGYEARWTQV